MSHLSIRTLASGSSGNMALVRSGRTTLAVDFGIPSQRGIRAALNAAGIGIEDLDAAIVSHEHSDHLGYSGLALAAVAGVPVLAGPETALAAERVFRARRSSSLPEDLVRPIRSGTTYLVGDLEVTPFRVSHDVPTFGFTIALRFAGGARKVAIATDLGCAPEALVPRFADADAVLIEANYNDDLLYRSGRSVEDKARVASDRGHLSNLQSGGFLRRAFESSVCLPRHVILVHLSEDHNRPPLARAEVGGKAGPAIGKGTALHVAPRFDPGPLLEL